ncbi:hypothetical protein E2F50_03790 [Rhizobium deserti]|uniref:TnsA endonuclease N-terminal domain-containing protein n=1 Tax=Rhizobium deserti TaxID=2547961 RepID=A0A4R5UMY5_9HYPH|nr:hypothetical protein [Rhizobium deserti]TDK39255.1 hypothetical protein E2F50_03790 [Rhizobium deserti]
MHQPAKRTGPRGFSAMIVRAADGGPIRTLAIGRQKKPVGRYPAYKASGRALPEESPAEVSVIQICEVSPYVRSVLAQPHRLEISVRGRTRPLVYFPDFEMKVDAPLAAALEEGRSFGNAALEWPPRASTSGDVRTIVAEVKRPGDKRLWDPEYRQKLMLAREVYESLGFHFAVIEEERDIACVDGAVLRLIAYHTFVKVDNLDAVLALEFLAARGGEADLRELQEALGPGAEGVAKSHALQIRGVLSFDVLRYRSGTARVVAGI